MDYIILLKLVSAIVLLLVMVMKKVGPEIAIFTSSIFLMLICGEGLSDYAALFKIYLSKQNVYITASTIFFISLLSSVMNKTGMMKKMIDSLESAIHNPKLTLMLSPLLIGLLTVVGGAYISCPIVEAVGKKTDASPEKLAAVNLIFRHCIHPSYPLASTFYMTAAIAGITHSQLFPVTLPLAAGMTFLGYFCVVRPIKVTEKYDLSEGENKAGSLKNILLYFSPILLTLVLTIAVGLITPVSVFCGLILALIIANSKEDTKPQVTLTELLFKGFKMKTILVCMAALFFRETIGYISEINAALSALDDMGMPPELVIVIISFLIAIPTGHNGTAVAISTPVAITFAKTAAQIPMYAALCMACGLMFYFFSPVHMCQLLTIEYFKTDLRSLYKEYKIFAPALLIFIIIWYSVMKLVFFA